MNGLLRIRQRYQGLAQSDKKLADYLLLQPDTARHLSSQQLANEAGVSQSSVVKFAQKLGYKGFPALKLALSEALASQPESPSVPIHNQIRGDDPLRLVGEKLIKENTAAMYATLNVNSEEKLHECVTMLRSARRIILTGIGASGLVAQNFAWKLMKIGFNAAAVRDMHALLATVQASSPDDLLLAISYTGVRRELNLAADEMLRVGVPALRIISLSFPLAGFGIGAGAVFQALGFSVYSMIISLIRQLVVLIPCAYLIGMLTGDVTGVWWAFVVAEVVSLTVSALYLRRVNRDVIQTL